MSEPMRMVINEADLMAIPKLADLQWSDIWPRRFSSGGSEAYLGAFTILLIARPFTAGENAALAWVMAQDECVMSVCYPLSDGRDFILLDRCHVRQSREEAIAEQRQHLTFKLECLGIIPEGADCT